MAVKDVIRGGLSAAIKLFLLDGWGVSEPPTPAVAYSSGSLTAFTSEGSTTTFTSRGSIQ